MRKVLTLVVALTASLTFASTAAAKCYHFSAAPSDVGVCVGKDGRDTFADRKQAQKICDAKLGKSCGNVSSSASSCSSGSSRCYDEAGTGHRSLSGY